MKSLLLLAFVTPMLAAAQTKQDAHLVARFVNYYNKRQTDSICTLFPDEKSTGIKCFWKGADKDGTYNIYGTITAYEYMGITGTDPGKVTMYKVTFSKKGPIAMRFNVGEHHKFTIFLLEPLSD